MPLAVAGATAIADGEDDDDDEIWRKLILLGFREFTVCPLTSATMFKPMAQMGKPLAGHQTCRIRLPRSSRCFYREDNSTVFASTWWQFMVQHLVVCVRLGYNF